MTDSRRLSITIPDRLSERLNKVKGTLNVSAVCQEALQTQVSREEARLKVKGKMKPVAHKFKLSAEEKELVDQIKDKKYKDRVTASLRQIWEWGHTPEGINNDLDPQACSEYLQYHIVMALYRLPDEVREFVYENCRFSSVSDTAVHRTTEDVKRYPWLILLHEQELDEDYQGIIARTIAHAYLDHKQPGIGWEVSEAAKYDKEAAALVKKWGFVGPGAKPDPLLAKYRKPSRKRRKATGSGITVDKPGKLHVPKPGKLRVANK